MTLKSPCSLQTTSKACVLGHEQEILFLMNLIVLNYLLMLDLQNAAVFVCVMII